MFLWNYLISLSQQLGNNKRKPKTFGATSENIDQEILFLCTSCNRLEQPARRSHVGDDVTETGRNPEQVGWTYDERATQTAMDQSPIASALIIVE